MRIFRARIVHGFASSVFREAHLFDRLAHLGGLHVIKKDDIGAVIERVAQLVEIRHFDFDPRQRGLWQVARLGAPPRLRPPFGYDFP